MNKEIEVKCPPLKRSQVDCEWCPKTDCAGYQVMCDLNCFHYVCKKCFKTKISRDLKGEKLT